MLYARRGRLPKGVKSPQPKTDRKGQSQTVQTLRAQHPLKYLLHIANLPKSSFYYHHQDRPDPDEADKALLVETYRRHKGRYGQRRIAAALDWNRKKVARLMKQLELKALIRAKKAYRHPAMGKISEHLLKRRFTAQKPNEKWLTDVTELKGKDGKLYLSPILDLFNREIVAYAMSRRADSEMVKEMLKKAAPRLTDKGTMLHSDQGVLYRTAGYRELLAEHSMVQSMSRKANCWDNAPMESFFAVLKTECFYNACGLIMNEIFTSKKPEGSNFALISDIYPWLIDVDGLVERCTRQNPAERPNIKEVSLELKLKFNELKDEITLIKENLEEHFEELDSSMDCDSEIKEKIIKQASNDILTAKYFFENKTTQELEKYNHNYHCNVHYKLDTGLRRDYMKWLLKKRWLFQIKLLL